MKILICGSRDWTDPTPIYRRVEQLPAGSLVIEGGADGADKLAWAAATRANLFVAEVEVPGVFWRRDVYGKRAGHLRNSAMLELGPELVIAFTTKNPPTPGTANMMMQARERGVPVELHTPGGVQLLG